MDNLIDSRVVEDIEYLVKCGDLKNVLEDDISKEQLLQELALKSSKLRKLDVCSAEGKLSDSRITYLYQRNIHCVVFEGTRRIAVPLSVS